MKKHIRRDLIDLADKLKRLAARFEICGFMPSINRYAQQVSWKSAELYADIALEVWPGDSKGETHCSLKPSDALNPDDAYAKDLLHKVMDLTEKTYLSKASPQQASIEMMRVADLIQKDLLQSIEACADLSETKDLKSEGLLPPDSESTAKKKSLPPSRLRAYGSRKYAKEKNAELKSATLKQIYSWLADTENKAEEDHPYYGLKMPIYKTWEKYVREAQQHYGTQRNQPRAGRSYGRSVVRANQVEYSSSQQSDKNRTETGHF